MAPFLSRSSRACLAALAVMAAVGLGWWWLASDRTPASGVTPTPRGTRPEAPPRAPKSESPSEHAAPRAAAGADAIAGHVVDSAGQPLQGARVYLVAGAGPMSSWERDDRARWVVSRADGSFSFDGVPALDPLYLGAELNGMHGAWPTASNATAGEMDLVLVMQRRYALAGVVVQASGEPAAGASVWAALSSPDHEGGGTGALAGDDGKFEVALSGDGTLEAVAQHSHGSARVVVEVRDGAVAGGGELRLVLVEGLVLAGSVQDEDGSPVAGAQITANSFRVASADTQPWIGATSGADGRFRIAGLAAGSGRLEVAHEDHVWTEVEAAAGDQDIVVTLARGARLSGVVLDQHGRPVAGASAVAEPPHPLAAWRGLYDSSSTDAEGRFLVKGLPMQELLVRAVAYGFQDGKPIAVDLREVRELRDLELRVSSGSSIRGRVVDLAGQPVSGAAVGVALMPEEVTDPRRAGHPAYAGSYDAGDQGGFTITGLDENRLYMLHAQREGFVLEPDADSSLLVPAGSLDVELVLRRGGRIRGRVLNAAGGPVPAATVSVRGEGRGPGGMSTDQVARTDAEGAYVLSGVGAGQRQLECRAEGYADPEPIELAIAEGEQSEGVDIALGARLEGVIAGRVTDQNGKAVAAQWLSFELPRDEREPPYTNQGARTDDKGEFRCDGLEDREYEVRFSAEGFLLEGHRFTAPRARPGDFLELKVKRLGAVRGRVVDGNGKPVADASLSLMRDSDEMGGFGGRGMAPTTRGNGTFVLRLTADPMDVSGLTVSAPGGRVPVTVPLRFSDPGQDIDLGDIVVRDGLAVEGQVQSAAGAPVAGASLYLSAPRELADEERKRLPTASATSDSAGQFRLEGLVQGSYSLYVDHPAYLRVERRPCDVSAGMAPLRVTMESGGSLHGQVRRADGRPVAGAGVGAGGHDAETDATGHYRITGLAAGTHHVSATLPVTTGRLEITRVVEHPGTGDILCDLGDWSQACVVHGRVIGLAAGHRSLGFDDVTLYSPGEGDRIRVEADLDEELRFRFPPVPPGSYELGLSSIHSQRVQVPASATYELDIELPGGSISGTVKRSDGGRVGSAHVRSRRIVADSWDHHASVQSDEEGSFTLSHAPPGNYELDVSIFGYGDRLVEGISVAAGQAVSGLEILVSGGGHIDVSVLDPTGSPVDDAHVACHDERSRPGGVSPLPRLARGRWRLEGLAPGVWQVFAGNDEHGTAAAPPVTLPEGGSAEITIQLPADSVPLRIRVLEHGEPCPGRFVAVLDDRGEGVVDLSAGWHVPSTGADGVVRTGPLRPGTYTVRVHLSREDRVEKQVTIPAGAEVATVLLEVGR